MATIDKQMAGHCFLKATGIRPKGWPSSLVPHAVAIVFYDSEGVRQRLEGYCCATHTDSAALQCIAELHREAGLNLLTVHGASDNLVEWTMPHSGRFYTWAKDEGRNAAGVPIENFAEWKLVADLVASKQMKLVTSKDTGRGLKPLLDHAAKRTQILKGDLDLFSFPIQEGNTDWKDGIIVDDASL